MLIWESSDPNYTRWSCSQQSLLSAGGRLQLHLVSSYKVFGISLVKVSGERKDGRLSFKVQFKNRSIDFIPCNSVLFIIEEYQLFKKKRRVCGGGGRDIV